MGQHHTMSSGSVPSSNNGKKLHYKAQALQEIKNSLTPFALVSNKPRHDFDFKEVFHWLLSDLSVSIYMNIDILAQEVVIIFTIWSKQTSGPKSYLPSISGISPFGNWRKNLKIPIHAELREVREEVECVPHSFWCDPINLNWKNFFLPIFIHFI